mmetsp:Transcript_26947/g.30830  ORF Transcript_26947/g.30830 Transcript_26947/m.30830 type:complete len:134 (-) Transcript_26947:179-580(-)
MNAVIFQHKVRSSLYTISRQMGNHSTSIASADTKALTESIVQETSRYQVVLYSKTYCPYCTNAKSLFKTNFPNATTKVVELDKLSNGSDIQSILKEMTGQRTVPSVWINGKFIGGNDDTQHLFRTGQLSKMFT